MHSGDSACALPPQTLSDEVIATLHTYTRKIADALRRDRSDQRAVRRDRTRRSFVLEANPRASRTVPFVAKATGVALAQVAVRVMMGQSWRRCATRASCLARRRFRRSCSVKEAVLPFSRFPGVDTILGPEMRSTGEVMGMGERLRHRVSRRPNWLAGTRLPDKGQVFHVASPTETRWRAWSWPDY